MNFKIGSRVKYKHITDRFPEKSYGTVRYFFGTGLVGVEWDKYIRNGHDGNGYFEGKEGHCWVVIASQIELKDIQLELEF